MLTSTASLHQSYSERRETHLKKSNSSSNRSIRANTNTCSRPKDTNGGDMNAKTKSDILTFLFLLIVIAIVAFVGSMIK
jgi:hypothetical protein